MTPPFLTLSDELLLEIASHLSGEPNTPNRNKDLLSFQLTHQRFVPIGQEALVENLSFYVENISDVVNLFLEHPTLAIRAHSIELRSKFFRWTKDHDQRADNHCEQFEDHSVDQNTAPPPHGLSDRQFAEKCLQAIREWCNTAPITTSDFKTSWEKDIFEPATDRFPQKYTLRYSALFTILATMLPITTVHLTQLSLDAFPTAFSPWLMSSYGFRGKALYETPRYRLPVLRHCFRDIKVLHLPILQTGGPVWNNFFRLTPFKALVEVTLPGDYYITYRPLRFVLPGSVERVKVECRTEVESEMWIRGFLMERVKFPMLARVTVVVEEVVDGEEKDLVMGGHPLAVWAREVGVEIEYCFEKTGWWY